MRKDHVQRHKNNKHKDVLAKRENVSKISKRKPKTTQKVMKRIKIEVLPVAPNNIK